MSERNKSGIYTIKNTVNGKCYVGQAASIGDRWLTHKSHLSCGRHHNRHLQSAWKKHGAESFVFEVLEYVPKDRDLLAAREQHWFDVLRPKYNLAPVAGSSLGFKHPPRSNEFKERMRATKLGFRHSPETIERLRVMAKELNYSHPPEVRQRISDALKGRPMPAKHLERLRAINTGRKQSADEIKRRSESNTGQKRTPEQRARISASLTGKRTGTKLSEQHKANIAAGLKGKRRPDVSAALGGRKRPEHVIAALKAANDARYAERRARLVDALNRHPEMSAMAIARMVGVDREMVAKYRKELQCQQPLQNANESAAPRLPKKRAPSSTSPSPQPQQLSFVFG